MGNRKGVLFAFVTSASVLALASTAFACVTFMGQMEVKGHDGKTEVVGTGNSHGYCSTGRPTTAAAGHLGDPISLEVRPATCADPLAAGAHQLPDGTYEVRYRNFKSYTFDGTYWNMIGGTGCFRSVNSETTTTLGTFAVSGGRGSWSGSIGLSDLKGVPVFSLASEANNFCIGAPSLPPVNGIIPGLLAPYQLLAI